jgi:hypothetical protein
VQQGAPACQDDPLLGNVGGELGRGPLQRRLHGIHDGIDGIVKGLADIAVTDGEGLGDAVHQVAALDLHLAGFVEGIGGAELDLDVLRRALAHQEVVLPLQVLGDGFVHLVPGDPAHEEFPRHRWLRLHVAQHLSGLLRVHAGKVRNLTDRCVVSFFVGSLFGGLDFSLEFRQDRLRHFARLDGLGHKAEEPRLEALN